MKPKHIITIAMIWAVCFALGYLAGAFAFATFDLTKWSVDGRGYIALFASIFSAFGTIGYIAANTDTK